MSSVCGKYVSQKIRKIKWKPVPKNLNQKPDIFVTGSWDNKVNLVTVWQNVQPQIGDDSMALESDPKMLHEMKFDGDVTDLKYLNSELLVTASSTGTVSIYRHERNQAQSLKVHATWPKVHRFPQDTSPCTGVDVYGDSIVSVGEDGRLVHYDTNHHQPIRTIDADSCVNTAVKFLKQNEVITANTMGQLKLWDIRSPSTDPVRLLLMAGEQNSLHCLSHHPTQMTILACGNEDGTLCIWDLKQDKGPAILLSAHEGPMLDLQFHPQSPNHLFTCSMDGMIWHWDASALVTTSSLLQPKPKTMASESLTGANRVNPWMLCSDASKNHLDICSLIPSSRHPINSLDILEDVLLCGSDKEAFYIISNLKLH